jgi:hypothetical protein
MGVGLEAPMLVTTSSIHLVSLAKAATYVTRRKVPDTIDEIGRLLDRVPPTPTMAVARGRKLLKWLTRASRDGYGDVKVLEETEDPFEADLISSHIGNDMHMPCLDIDFHADLVRSGTPGHFHLYLDKPIPWKKYKALLKALADAGIIEQGYLKMSLKDGATLLRTPEKPKPISKVPNTGDWYY